MEQRSPIVMTGGASGSRTSVGMPTPMLTCGPIIVCAPMLIHRSPYTDPGGNAIPLARPIDRKRRPAASSGDTRPTAEIHSQARCIKPAATLRTRGESSEGANTRAPYLHEAEQADSGSVRPRLADE